MRVRRALLLAAAISFGAGAFDLQGHRGARGLAPENTLPAFERALSIGVTTLELDVGVTADGVVVISHDSYVNPTLARDGTGKWLSGAKGPSIHSLTLAQLRSYDVGRIKPDTPYARTFSSQQPHDGTSIPTLASLFALVKALGAREVRFNIETKIDPTRPDDTLGPEAMTRALLQVITHAGMRERVSIQSFDWRSLEWARRLAPEIPRVCLTVQTAENNNVNDTRWTGGFSIAESGSVPRLVKAAGCAVWSPNAAALSETLLHEAQSLGLKVIPWTIYKPAEMERLIGWGVDGMITDYPDRLRTVMQSRNLPLPPPIRN